MHIPFPVESNDVGEVARMAPSRMSSAQFSAGMRNRAAHRKS